MSHEDNKAISRRAHELWASGNSENPEAILAESYVNHQESDVQGGVTTKSRDAYVELVGGYHDAFTDSRVSILMQIAEGDLVATRWEFTATHTGDFLGFAPTNKVVTWTGVQIDRIENREIVESWVAWDKYRLFAGLGLVRQP